MCKGFRKHIRVWALCLATLFAAYYATTALFTHVHMVNDIGAAFSVDFFFIGAWAYGSRDSRFAPALFITLYKEYIPCRMLLYGRDVPPCSSCTIVLIGNLKNIVLIF